MARSFAAVYTRIWADPTWRALDVNSQHLYLLLLSQDNLNLAGVIPLQLRRWSKCVAGWDTAAVDEALERLQGQSFVVVDEDTEEVLIRTLIRNDGAYKAPGSLKAILTLAAAAQSPVIRAVLAAELGKLDRLEGKTADAGTAAITATRAVLAPSTDPTPDGTPDGIGDGTPDGFLATHPRWDVSSTTQPTPDPTPDGTGSGSGSGSVPSFSLVGILGGKGAPPPPGEPPLCAKHDGMDRDEIPGCRACKRLRENWEITRAEAAKPPPLPPLCGDCDNRWIQPVDDGPAKHCPRCHPAEVRSA